MGRNKTDEELLRRLEGPQGSFVSGEALAQELGVSRTAIWKRLKKLKAKGFPIESLRSRGYRFNGVISSFNEFTISAGLTTEFIGRKIHFFDKLYSTNDKAANLARQGAPEGTVVISETQEGGRGRLGRPWTSPSGVNLYASVILRPRVAPHELQGITLLAAVAVAEAVGHFATRAPSVKWPNDVLLDSKKVAGILMEMHTEAELASFVIAGIGVNVNMDKKMFPGELRHKATSIISASGEHISRTDFAQKVFLSLEIWYKTFLEKGLSAIIDAWRKYFTSEGKAVRVRSAQKTIEGTCLGVDNDGALLVRLPSGVTERVLAGDIEQVAGAYGGRK